MPAGIRRSSGLVTVPPPVRAVAYTPVVTWTGNTITTQSGFYIKEPGKLLVWVSFVESAGTAVASITITIPTGYTAVSMAGGLSTGVGMLSSSIAGGTFVGMVAAAGATTQVVSAATLIGAVATWYISMQIPTLT